ncbi:MAG: hypothetical protein QM758_06820 [Armatimonas sp.]
MTDKELFKEYARRLIRRTFDSDPTFKNQVLTAIKQKRILDLSQASGEVLDGVVSEQIKLPTPVRTISGPTSVPRRSMGSMLNTEASLREQRSSAPDKDWTESLKGMGSFLAAPDSIGQSNTKTQAKALSRTERPSEARWRTYGGGMGSTGPVGTDEERGEKFIAPLRLVTTALDVPQNAKMTMQLNNRVPILNDLAPAITANESQDLQNELMDIVKDGVKNKRIDYWRAAKNGARFLNKGLPGGGLPLTTIDRLLQGKNPFYNNDQKEIKQKNAVLNSFFDPWINKGEDQLSAMARASGASVPSNIGNAVVAGRVMNAAKKVPIPNKLAKGAFVLTMGALSSTVFGDQFTRRMADFERWLSGVEEYEKNQKIFRKR